MGRFRKVIGKLVSMNQSTFVLDISLSDVILIVNEVVNYARRNKKNCSSLKLTSRRSLTQFLRITFFMFSREWNSKIFRSIGFEHVFVCVCVSASICLCSNSFSILIKIFQQLISKLSVVFGKVTHYPLFYSSWQQKVEHVFWDV